MVQIPVLLFRGFTAYRGRLRSKKASKRCNLYVSRRGSDREGVIGMDSIIGWGPKVTCAVACQAGRVAGLLTQVVIWLQVGWACARWEKLEVIKCLHLEEWCDQIYIIGKSPWLFYRGNVKLRFSILSLEGIISLFFTFFVFIPHMINAHQKLRGKKADSLLYHKYIKMLG